MIAQTQDITCTTIGAETDIWLNIVHTDKRAKRLAESMRKRCEMSKSRASKLNGYRSIVSRQKNDVYKFKQKRKKEETGIDVPV